MGDELMRLGRAWLVMPAVAAALAAGCSQPAPKRYPLHGQILAIDAAHQQLTVKHDDIPGFMPGMTMSYPVATPFLMQGRTPGETINATLEVSDMTGRLVQIEHTGSAPLPAGTNAVAMASALLNVGDAMPDVALIDQRDRRRSLAEWKGVTTLITFVYTRCPLPNFCPLMDHNFEILQRRLSEDSTLKGRVKLISVSIDPTFDTPLVLAAHAARVKADPAVWTFLTGDVGTIDHLAAQFGVGVLRDPADATNITHNLRTTLIGADGRLEKVYSGNDWTPEDVLSDLRTLGGLKA
ncbi:MAG TPA: SCO family protein [Vicinamibacterales bacterium]